MRVKVRWERIWEGTGKGEADEGDPGVLADGEVGEGGVGKAEDPVGTISGHVGQGGYGYATGTGHGDS